MTKQEQIKEAAHAICGQSKNNICLIDNNSCDCDCCWARDAEGLYNAGYRKVPENVILLDFNTEAGMASYTVMPRDEFVRNVSSRKAVEKNAVKEFAEKMKEKFEGYDATSYNGHEEGFHDLQEEIDELLRGYEK